MIGFQFYAAGTFQFLIILVQGSILFAKGANRSEHFARRLTLDLLGLFLISLPLTLGYWRIDQAAGSAVLSNLAIVVLYLTLYLLTAAMLKRCFQLSCRSCLMAAATGYVCQHIFYEIRLIVNAFLKLDVALYAAVGWHAGFWVSFFLELAMAEGVLFLLHRLFGQRAAAFSLDDASSSDVTLMIVATLGLVLIVNAFLNIYASESQALAMLVRALLTIACLFILLLRAGFLKSGHLQSELEVLSRLHEQERRHYEKLDGVERCIDDELPFEIPDSWEWVRLGTVFQHNTGKALNASNRDGEKLTYITTSNLYWDRFVLENLKTMPFTDSEVDKCTVQQGDLLVCEGGDIGRAAIWESDEPMRIQNHIHRLRAYVPVCTRFFYHLFYLYKGAGWIGGKGIAIQGLSSNAIHNLLFPLPPLHEQERIVNAIDTALSVVQKL